MKEELEQPLSLSSRKRRIAAFLIDHFVMTFIMISVVFLVMGPNFIDENNLNLLTTTMVVIMLPGFLLYFAKDSVKGISLGKWIMGIMVRDANNQNLVPSFGRLLIRNLFIIIWPIEFIVLASSQEKKRLGDKIAKTIVVVVHNQSTILSRVLTFIGVGIAFFAFTFLTANTVMKNSDAYKVAIIEIEQNQEILNETGGIKDFGFITTGNVSLDNGIGQAQLQIKVIGHEQDMIVNVYLLKELEGEWEIIEMNR